MNCPKCAGKLQKKDMVGVEVDVCYICEGIWFDAGELKQVIEADSKNFKYIDVGKEEFDGKEAAEYHKMLDKKRGKCPRCEDGTMLVPEEYKGKHTINVDICPKGHGIWLDGGEIAELRKRGLADLKDRMEAIKDVMKYSFSKDGFNDFLRRIGLRKK